MHLTVLLDLFTDRHDRFLNLSYIFWRVKMYRKLMVREIIELLFCLFAFPFSSCWHTCLYCCCNCCLSCNSMCCCSLRISSSCWSWVLCKISANWSRSISNWRMEADSESTYKSNSTKFHFSNACKGILLACIQTPPPPFPQEKKKIFPEGREAGSVQRLHPASRVSFWLSLEWGGERRLCLNCAKPLKSPTCELLD